MWERQVIHDKETSDGWPSLANVKDRPCSTSLVINICLQLNIIYLSWCYHLQWPPLAWACSQYICQSYKSSEFRLAQYLPLYIWSQSPSLHLIDQTTPRIRISSMGSLYRSWFTSAWQSAVSGSMVRQKRLQADYISFRTYLWVKMAVIGRPQEKNARLSLFYKGLHGLAAIPVNELQRPTWCTRRQNVVCTDVTDEDPCNTERIATISVYFT